MQAQFRPIVPAVARFHSQLCRCVDKLGRAMLPTRSLASEVVSISLVCMQHRSILIASVSLDCFSEVLAGKHCIAQKTVLKN